MSSFRHVAAALALAASASIALPSCGARSALVVGGGELRSSAFCGRGEDAAGYKSLSIYLLLDKSGSMLDDSKWTEVSAALGAFVDDPLAAELGVRLHDFPTRTACAETDHPEP